MNARKSIFLIITLMIAAQPAVAWEGVEVVEAEGYINRWVSYSSSPTPGFCLWEQVTPVLSFQATNADGDEFGDLGCDDPWFVHCDSDSMVYRAAWPANNAPTVTSSNYESTLTCRVNITATTGMFNTRSAVGNLDEDFHRLLLEHPDGTVVTIFPAGSGPDDVQLVLDPGTFLVSILVLANQSHPVGGNFDPYSSHILVEWGDPESVAVEPASWSSVKAIFR